MFSGSLGQALCASIVPSLSKTDINEERFAGLVDFWQRARVPSALASLPFFAGLNSDVAASIEVYIRRSLQGYQAVEVGWAARALWKWMDLAEQQCVPTPPKSLMSKMIYLIDSERSIGLSNLMYYANNMLRRGWLSSDDIGVLAGAVCNIWQSFGYEILPADGGTAVATPLVRSRCVQLAESILKVLPSAGLKRIISEAGEDPLPEVRFALEEVDLED